MWTDECAQRWWCTLIKCNTEAEQKYEEEDEDGMSGQSVNSLLTDLVSGMRWESDAGRLL